MANDQKPLPPSLISELMELDVIQLRKAKIWIDNRLFEKERYSARGTIPLVPEERVV